MQLFRKVPVLTTSNGDVPLNDVALEEVTLKEIALPVSFEYSKGAFAPRHSSEASRTFVIGAVVIGVLAGAVASAYWWKNRVREEILQATPLERVEELIASCESKIEDIERTIENLKGNER